MSCGPSSFTNLIDKSKKKFDESMKNRQSNSSLPLKWSEEPNLIHVIQSQDMNRISLHLFYQVLTLQMTTKHQSISSNTNISQQI